MADHDRSGNIAVLLGMYTWWARAIGALYFLALLLLAVTSWSGVEHIWPIVIALLITAAEILLLLDTRRDPLSPWATAFITAGIPASAALVMAVVPTPPLPAQLWFCGAGCAISTYVCVRGRSPYAWLAMIMLAGVGIGWTVWTGMSPQYVLPVVGVSFGPLCMATFFAYTVRPAAHEIFVLRARSTQQAAERSASAALLAERYRQSEHVDVLVRPMMKRIVHSEPLSTDERLECELLEGQLRDTLRAPTLIDVSLADEARAARRRGVDLVMIDDGALDRVDANDRAEVIDRITRRLREVRRGAVTVRVLPPDRPLAATMVIVSETGATERMEITVTGESVDADTLDPGNRHDRDVVNGAREGG